MDVADLRRSCRYEDGYSGREDVISWFWDAVETFDDAKTRQLLQFWSGSDGMPAEGFGPLDPPFHMVAVDRLYDANDKTARLVRGCGGIVSHHFTRFPTPSSHVTCGRSCRCTRA